MQKVSKYPLDKSNISKQIEKFDKCNGNIFAISGGYVVMYDFGIDYMAVAKESVALENLPTINNPPEQKVLELVGSFEPPEDGMGQWMAPVEEEAESMPLYEEFLKKHSNNKKIHLIIEIVKDMVSLKSDIKKLSDLLTSNYISADGVNLHVGQKVFVTIENERKKSKPYIEATITSLFVNVDEVYNGNCKYLVSFSAHLKTDDNKIPSYEKFVLDCIYVNKDNIVDQNHKKLLEKKSALKKELQNVQDELDKNSR